MRGIFGVSKTEEHVALSESVQTTNGEYGSVAFTKPHSPVRFQVVIWYIGPIDVVLGLVKMKFRVTIFWNAPTKQEHDAMATQGYGTYDAKNKRVWTMHGRQRAYQRELTEMLDINLVYVPPISIMNAVDFTVMGEPEICLVDEQNKKYKWTCMYMASLIQEHMRVDTFPHDKHDLVLKLGIIKHRQAGKRWDRNKWRIALATEQDSQGTIRVPYGLVVDHVKIPEFSFNPKEDFAFEVASLVYGPQGEQDECLQVRLSVVRDSGYYDKNIIPLLAMLNVVGISTLTLDALEFGSRGEIILAIAFVAIGIRLTVDSKLPQVGYQIKLQRILNRFFYTLLFMHVESSIVYTLTDRYDWTHDSIDAINTAAMILSGIYTVIQLVDYYRDYHRRNHR